MSLPTTKLQGSITAPSDAVIQFTSDPLGLGLTSDFTITAGDQWDSTDDLIQAIEAQVESDIGPGFNFTVTASTGKVDIETDGSNFSLYWSHTGDGTAIRDYLGETGNIVNQATGYDFPLRHKAGFYPTHPLRQIRRRQTTSNRMHMMTISGASRTQHNYRGEEDDPPQSFDLSLWFDTASSYAEIDAFETFLSEMWTATGGGEPFSVFHDGVQWVLWFEQPIVDLSFSRVADGWNGLWQTSLALVGFEV